MLRRQHQGVILLFTSLLCLIAFCSSNANAEEGRYWLLNGSKLTEALSPAVESGVVEEKLSLVSKIAGVRVEFSCLGLVLENAKLQTNGSISSGAKAKLTKCTTTLNEKLSSACEPIAESEAGNIISKEIKGLLVLHEDELVEHASIVKLQAQVGETLGTVQMGKECSIGTKVPVIGTLTLKGLTLETQSPTQSFSDGPLNELWVITKTAEHQAAVKGRAETKLSGEHAGSKWGVPAGLAVWKVKGAQVTSLSPTLSGSVESGGLTFLTSVIGVKITLNCSGASLIGASLKSSGAISNFNIQYSGCLLKLNEKVTSCQPLYGSESGVLRTSELKGLLILHAGEGIIRIEPTVGSSILTFELNNECFLASKVSIFGKLTLNSMDLRSEASAHSFSEGALTELWFVNESPEHKVTLDGSTTLRLGGLHTGLPWSGVFQ